MRTDLACLLLLKLLQSTTAPAPTRAPLQRTLQAIYKVPERVQERIGARMPIH